MLQRYQVGSEVRKGIEIFGLDENVKGLARVTPGLGNNCYAFRVQEPILEEPTFEEFCQRPTSYGIPILFPFPNRISDGEFRFRGKRYAVNPNRHGFVRDKAWQVLESGASEQEGAWINSSLESYQYPEQILKQFPFPFRLEVTYRLRNGRLEMETRVQNIGEREMPFGFGIHPYFQLPEKGTILVHARKYWELVEYLPTGNLKDAEGRYDLRQPRDLAGLVLDDIFTDLIPDPDGAVRCVLHDQRKGMQTVIEFDGKQFPNVVVYTPSAPRRAICIEPYTCPTDAFNLHDRGIECNLAVLQPKGEISYKVSIYAQKSAVVMDSKGGPA